jgi:hypothetical protein
MNAIEFPRKTDQHYYDIHFQYVLNLALAAGVQIKIVDDLAAPNRVSFRARIDGRSVVFAFCDDPTTFDGEAQLVPSTNDPTFKFHMIWPHMCANVFPFPPVSFHDWGLYGRLSQSVHYPAHGRINNRQRPYGNARERRIRIQNLLHGAFPGEVDTEFIRQPAFLEEISASLVGVCVPGFCNQILDRGQLQWMALGACTISPMLCDQLPYWANFTSQHYIRCNSDYSDLVEIIQWCKANPDKCIEKGRQAKALFERTCTPVAAMGWVEKCLAECK